MDTSTLTLIGLLVSVVALTISVWSTKRYVRSQTFLQFTARYDKIAQKLAIVLERKGPDNERVLYQYLNLRSEEYYCQSVGEIPKAVWAIWEVEMIDKIREIKERYPGEWEPLLAQIKPYHDVYSWVLSKSRAKKDTRPQAGDK